MILYGCFVLLVLGFGLAYGLSRSTVLKQWLRGNATVREGTEGNDRFARQWPGLSWMSEDPDKRATQPGPGSRPQD